MYKISIRKPAPEETKTKADAFREEQKAKLKEQKEQLKRQLCALIDSAGSFTCDVTVDPDRLLIVVGVVL